MAGGEDEDSYEASTVVYPTEYPTVAGLRAGNIEETFLTISARTGAEIINGNYKVRVAATVPYGIPYSGGTARGKH